MSSKYLLSLSSQARKTLKKIPIFIADRIEARIGLLEGNPYLGVKMNGDMAHLRKLKVSNYRIIYEVIESKIIIIILEIESRGNISYDR
jgi:mRNA interferase RelE/StbE